jgi:hypothetical protein
VKAEAERHKRSVARNLRSHAYVNDPERPPDEIDKLTAEIDELGRLPRSAERDARIELLEKDRNLLLQLVKDRRALLYTNTKLKRERSHRKQLLEDSKDTSAIDEKIAEIESDASELRAAIRQNRVRAAVRGQRETVPAPDNDAYLSDIERELDASAVDPARLAELERELHLEITREIDDGPLPEFFEALWSDGESEEERLEEPVAAETAAIDDTRAQVAEYLAMPPSPERTARVHSSVERLRGEINEERARLRSLDTVLSQDYAALVLARQSSSRGSAIDAELQELRDARTHLRIKWQQNMQRRLAQAQSLLLGFQSNPRFRDDAVEAELARQIALYDNELTSFSRNSDF